MTIIAYDAKTMALYADSGVAINYRGYCETRNTGENKVWVSKCGRVAFATSGYSQNEDTRQLIEEFFISRLEIYSKTKDPAAFGVTRADGMRLGLDSQRIIALNSEAVYVYCADAADPGLTILVNKHDMPFAYGAFSNYVMVPLSMGVDIVKAMELAATHCPYSDLPIRSVGLKDLKEWKVETEEC